MTTETWRVVVEGGEVRGVTVTRTADGWGEKSFGEAYTCANDTPREAVIGYAAAFGCPVVEFVAPGALTSKERAAAMRDVVDDLARRAASCQTLLDVRGANPRIDGKRAAYEHAAELLREAIERGTAQSRETGERR